MALTALGFRSLPFHDPFHGPGNASHVGQEIELARESPPTRFPSRRAWVRLSSRVAAAWAVCLGWCAPSVPGRS
jgi:hypothetical protein